VNKGKNVDKVLDILCQNGYQPIPEGIRIGNLTFAFSGILVGTEHSFDLVVIVETQSNTDQMAIRRQVEALARALDMVESRRSFTLIIVGPDLNHIIVRELSNVCRILSIGTPTDSAVDKTIRAALAVLLPLDLPLATEDISSPLVMLHDRLSKSNDAEMWPIVDAALDGTDSVEQALRTWLLDQLEETS